MKRFTAFLASAILAIGLTSCTLLDAFSSQSEEKLEGQEIIENAMRRYNDQNSGGYEAVDNMTGKLIERFVYRYDEVGFLSFLCEVYGDDGSVSREYNSGYAVFVEEDGVGRKLSKNDERYVLYNKDMTRYERASDAVFGFMTEGVERIDKAENEDGSVQYTYVYDVDRSGIGAQDGKLLSYSLTYDVNVSGEVYRFRQQATGEYDSGEELRYDYTVTLLPSDSVGLIDNPITVSEAAKDDESTLQ